ncbi:hypothetical protein Tco_0487576 [Tanacetum coccineum]
MPLSNKTILDSHCFVHELKTEMHDDLEYVKSLEKEVDELESEKADFSNIYDLLLEECVSKDVTCSYLHSLSDLNAYAELQCMYLHKVKECECLALKLSKQTESVNNEVHNKLLKSFSKLEKHSISLELALQQCKEQMKNNSVCKENGSNVFRKEREQYHEIQDLKAQMQDKNIAISELKKLIENCKGKSVETQFNKPSVVRQPNAQRIPKPSVLGKPTPFSNSPEMRSFQTKQSVNKTNVSDGLFKQVTQQNLPQIRKQAVRNTNVIAPGPSRNCPKHVSHQSPREKVGSNDMVHNYYLEKAKKSAQLQKDKEVNGKPSMIDPARLPNTANGCKPKPRNWQASMSSRVSNKDVHLGEHRKQKPFLKFNDLQCPTCKKCLYSANHDECVLEYLSRLNPRASAQNKDAKSHKTTKRYMPVEKSSASKKPERQIPTGHRFSNKKTTTVPEKTMNPRSCLRWKPTGRIFSNVRLRWIPTGKLLNSCTGKVDSEPTHVSIVDIPHIHACKQTLGLSAGTSFNGQKQQRIDLNADALYNEKQENLRVWLLKLLISKKPVPEWPRSSMFKRRLITADQASVFMAMMSVHISSGLVLHQMTSDHNRSELGIQDHSNEQSSSKLVPKVVPLAVKTATSRQELELLFHHHIAMLRTTEILDLIGQMSATQSTHPDCLSIKEASHSSDLLILAKERQNIEVSQFGTPLPVSLARRPALAVETPSIVSVFDHALLCSNFALTSPVAPPLAASSAVRYPSTYKYLCSASTPKQHFHYLWCIPDPPSLSTYIYQRLLESRYISALASLVSSIDGPRPRLRRHVQDNTDKILDKEPLRRGIVIPTLVVVVRGSIVVLLDHCRRCASRLSLKDISDNPH